MALFADPPLQHSPLELWLESRLKTFQRLYFMMVVFIDLCIHVVF